MELVLARGVMGTSGRLNGVVEGAIWVHVALYFSLLVVLSCVVSRWSKLVREAYLQLATPTSITLVWRTNLSSPSDSRVSPNCVSG